MDNGRVSGRVTRAVFAIEYIQIGFAFVSMIILCSVMLYRLWSRGSRNSLSIVCISAGDM